MSEEFVAIDDLSETEEDDKRSAMANKKSEN